MGDERLKGLINSVLWAFKDLIEISSLEIDITYSNGEGAKVAGLIQI